MENENSVLFFRFISSLLLLKDRKIIFTNFSSEDFLGFSHMAFTNIKNNSSLCTVSLFPSVQRFSQSQNSRIYRVSMTLLSSDKANKCTLLEYQRTKMFVIGYIFVHRKDRLPRNDTYKICIGRCI